MQVRIRDRLSYRQAFGSLVTACALGTVFAVVQIGYDLSSERRACETMLRQVVSSLQASAAESAYNVDDRLAATVIRGLLACDPIIEAGITDDMGTLLARERRPRSAPGPGPFTRRVFGHVEERTVPLAYGRAGLQVGTLRITVDPAVAASGFMKRAALSIVIVISFAFALAAVLAFLFFHTLTKPLLLITRQVAEVDPGAPDKRMLEMPRSHAKDEMGILVTAVNRLLSGFASSLEQRREAEARNRRQQEELFQASKLVSLGTLVSGVAHEINNPNTYILSNTYNMEKIWESVDAALGDDDDARALPGGALTVRDARETVPALLGGIKKGAERIKQTVSSLRDFARRESGEAGRTEPVAVNEVVREAMVLLAPQTRKYTDNFRVEYAEDLPPVEAGFQRLEQVVINLVLNACQALEDKNGAVLVSTAFDRAAESVVIAVQDEGIGMDTQTRNRIFDPFFTTKSDSKGMGLGMAISARIVNDYGGRIEVGSKPGQGTSVLVLLPVAGTGRRGEPEQGGKADA
ncbi:MAG: hypothetical protein JXR37_04150 [Kiritimatiellae bacterium]|nr:hypothetical protein [Kiritimatiellia bacterium]